MTKKAQTIVLFFISLLIANANAQHTMSVSSLGQLYVDEVDFEVVWPEFDQEGLSILWWNINRNNVPICTPRERTVLEYNLEKIVNSAQRPKILILGEYLAPGSCLNHSLVELINKRYTYYPTKYTEVDPIHLAFGVFVDREIRLDNYKKHTLKWYPENATTEEYKRSWREKCSAAKEPAEIMYFERTFPQLDMTIDGKKLTIIGTHFLMPWNCEANSVAWPSIIGTGKVIKEIINGEDHPLYYQARDLVSKITDTMENVFIVGDWNIPTVASIAYSTTFDLFFNLGFQESLSKEWATYSFPTTFNPEGVTRKLHLDHAFHRGQVNILYSRILPIQGSDHYPLLTYIGMN